MDLSDSDMDTGDSSTLSSSEEGELESEIEEISDENENANDIDNIGEEEDQLADLLAENRQLKKKIQLLEGNNDPNCLCTIIWHNISNFDTTKIVKQLEKSKIEANQSKSKAKEESLPGYSHIKRPFSRKYFDLSKENEFDDLFIVDKNTSSVTTETAAPTYLSLSLETPEPVPLSLIAARPKQGNPCFNCGTDGHAVRDCPKPKDFRAINKNRALYLAAAPSEKRYWEDKASKFNPGELSPALREALSISSDATPPWYNKMLKFGYPPGYTREIGFSNDDIVIFDQASDASDTGKGIGGSSITPTIVFPGIDNEYLVQVSYAIATKTKVVGTPQVFAKTDIVSDIIEMKDSNKKAEKKGNQIKTKDKKNKKERKELSEGKGTNEKKKNQVKDSEKKGAKKEVKGEPKKKEKSLKKPREENNEIISGPKWSDASEGRYEPTEGTGVWKSLHPMLKKRKSEKLLSAFSEKLLSASSENL
jgi:hypothetical protein